LLVGPYKKEENPSYDEDFIRNIQLTLKGSGVFDKVRFVGMVEERQALAEIYRLSDIFMFPSRREGLGNVVLEAMASGLPVIISALSVLKNVITDQVNGLTVPIDDSKGISKGISYLINHPSEAYKLGDCARQHILKNHTFSAWEADLTKI
jgi:glycosyltransferase involved in cell wall biosynthesis